MTQIIQLNYEELEAAIKNCLREAVAEIKAIPDLPKLPDRCTLPEACEITGLSKSLIYKLCMDGAIPREKYGKRLVFSRKALNEWVQARTVIIPSPDEIMTDRLSETAKKRV
ncbi:MAG: helix-turn-helix domain-containing protein [Bacteroidales bacterium]|nr:helix-turn-helix domain-containing protein [Bacteroidales bacterium]